MPDRVLTNAELEKMVDTSDQWIQARTGIRRRHIAAEGELTGDLAERASRQAIDAAGLDEGDIDLILLATTTPDKIFPSTACLLQARLGIHGCPAFDVQAVCTGFVYALSVADKFIKSGAARNALVVGFAEELGASALMAEEMRYVSGCELPPGDRVAAKIRYRAKRMPARVWALPEGRARVVFDRALRDITPGQSVVLEREGQILGGGIISCAIEKVSA